MKNKKFLLKITSMGMALILTCNLFPLQPLRAEESINDNSVPFSEDGQNADEGQVQEVIEINTTEDFLEFADHCHLDSWSSNKLVLLNEDIDLSGVEFDSIPIFTGTFNGKNHTISGFRYQGEGYVAGFFRYIGKDGLVKNLRIEGEVLATDEKECIGGLCGINFGNIQKCSFQGTVSGQDTVGGIAGINEGTGIIRNSFAGGRVTGYYSTGGITGKNHGIVSFCNNRTCINNDSEWVAEDDEMGIGLFLSINISDSDAELFSGVDTGGIAGYSDGLITGCINYGKIGYEHTGYNTGGIVGRQSGIVSSCSNNGTVFGRKDIGGIVGQMEPYIEVDEVESLRNAVNELHDLIAKTIDDMEAGKNVAKKDLDDLAAYSDGATDAGDALASQMADFIDDNLDQAQAVADRLGHVMDMLPYVFDDVYDAEESFANAGSSLTLIAEDLKDIGNINGEYVETDYDRLSLLSTVGGNILSLQHYPEAGETVHIIAEPNEGYGLSSLRVIDENNRQISVRQSDEKEYTFTMPAPNVRVEAYFGYQGTAGHTADDSLTDDTGNTGNAENENAGDDREENSSGTDDSNSNSDPDSGPNDSDSQDTNNGSDDHTGGQNGSENDTGNGSEGGSNTELNTVTASDTIQSLDSVPASETVSPESYADGNPMPLASQTTVILSSNLSGNATCSIDGTTATLTVIPDGAYTVSGTPAVSSGGQSIPVSRTGKSEYSYTFPVTEGGTCQVNIVFGKLSKEQAVNSARGDITNAMKEQQAAAERVNAIIQEIQNGSSVSQDQLSELTASLEEMSNATAAVFSSLSVVVNIVGQHALEKMEDIGRDAEIALGHLQNAVDSIKSATRDARSIIDYVNGQPDIRFSKLGGEFDFNKETLHDQLKGMSDSIQSLSNNASNYSDVVNDDLRAVNDQINIIFNLLADNMTNYNDVNVEELYEEVDIEDTDSITTGKADSCINSGIIQGDINVGGIAGAMSIDEEDPEDSAAGSVDYQIGRRYFSKCIIMDSVNEGFITAKKDGAGGIVGYMKHGVVVDSEGYGSVESTEGDYVGGICGESFTVIRRCYALCSVAGGKNVGGIAGYADTLKDCYAIVDCSAQAGRMGAIAGQTTEYTGQSVDPESETENLSENRVSGNYYVSDDLYGIGNISYTGIAEPVSYQELLQAPNLPTAFWHLKVIFRVEDEYLGTQELKFGESLSALEYPAIPEREGYYGVWPDYSDQVMSGNLLITGEYKEDVTVVQSDGAQSPEADGGRQKPYALVEQRFTQDTVLNAVISDREPPEKARNKEYVIYDITLENADIDSSDTFAVRLYNPYEDAVVWGLQNGEWTELESKARGQYLQVDMTGIEESFCLVEHGSGVWITVVCIAGGVLLLLLLLLLIKKAKRRIMDMQNSKTSEAEKE